MGMPLLLDLRFNRAFASEFVGSLVLVLIHKSSQNLPPKFIEQTAHCDHKPRAAWAFVRLLLHRCSAAGCAECMIYSALMSIF